MPNIKLTISYDGTNYHGWQKQKSQPTIQGTIEMALKKILNEEVSLTGAGRTDAGVHAIGQVANFRIKKMKIPVAKLPFVLNNLLPQDIRILKAEEVNDNFNARKFAKSKTYLYVISNTPVQSPFSAPYSWHILDKLNLKRMREAGKMFTGKKDFRAFMASDSTSKSSIRTIKKLSITKKNGQIFITVSANGFLKQMVRNIVGTIVETGLGKLDPSEIPEIISSGDRKMAGVCAPARGLFLLKVDY
jgi:tRNA pseudouridine38-40 synthase